MYLLDSAVLEYKKGPQNWNIVSFKLFYAQYLTQYLANKYLFDIE